MGGMTPTYSQQLWHAGSEPVNLQEHVLREWQGTSQEAFLHTEEMDCFQQNWRNDTFLKYFTFWLNGIK